MFYIVANGRYLVSNRKEARPSHWKFTHVDCAADWLPALPAETGLRAASPSGARSRDRGVVSPTSGFANSPKPLLSCL